MGGFFRNWKFQQYLQYSNCFDLCLLQNFPKFCTVRGGRGEGGIIDSQLHISIGCQICIYKKINYPEPSSYWWGPAPRHILYSRVSLWCFYICVNKKHFFGIFFWPQMEVPPSTLSFYSITQWSGSTPGSLWEMTDSKPGPLPQKSGALPMKLPQETYTTITLIQIIELLTAKSLHNCVEL